jgi:hypothetical protein
MSTMPGAPGVPQPPDRAPHAAWMAYAIGQGMEEVQARGLTRDQLRGRFTALAEPLTGEPRLERHDEDPDARAARHETRRRPWERP